MCRWLFKVANIFTLNPPLRFDNILVHWLVLKHKGIRTWKGSVFYKVLIEIRISKLAITETQRLPPIPVYKYLWSISYHPVAEPAEWLIKSPMRALQKRNEKKEQDSGDFFFFHLPTRKSIVIYCYWRVWKHAQIIGWSWLARWAWRDWSLMYSFQLRLSLF